MNTKTAISIAVIAVALLGGAMFIVRDKSKNSETAITASVSNINEIISQRGIHWHPELFIVIKGARQPIPANIGIGMHYAGYPQYDGMMTMTDMHTHDNSGKLHWEVMDGPVKRDDVRLGQFFGVWGKKFDSSCIFEYCNSAQGTVRMFVNGQSNEDFENYLIKDMDKIEIRYE